MKSTRRLPLLCLQICLFCATWLAPAWALAQTAAEPASTAAVTQSARDWLQHMLQDRAAGPLRIELEVGQLDSRLKLAPCAQVEPYLPPGSELWGKTRLGLRCVQGAVRWNVFLPITVKAFGPAWVVKDAMNSGTVLTESDAMLTEVDWADQKSPVVATATGWVGMVAARSLMPGQTLRQDMIKPAQAFAAGTQVRVIARGVGFELSTSAQAVSAGSVGQSVRVRMDNGKVISGRVQDGQTVVITL